ncbi:MAG: phage virion morphogenesis protein [Pseudomonadota bacterium]
MAGTTIHIDLGALESINKRLATLTRADTHGLLETIGAAVESQTRRRMTEDKTGPDGAAWDDWSPKYAATRHGGHSLLESQGHLVDSIHFAVEGDQVRIGSELVYAATHQHGDESRNIPARPYLGLSEQDRNEIKDVADDYLRSLVP